MAKSPSHKLGQMIGDLLEAAIEPSLSGFCRDHGLYLDKQGPRPARRGKKVTWTDLHGNSHDLDFVLERRGTRAKRGDPVGFIEVAWRRYTKHSRNKAQEIQGAVRPLVDTFPHLAPFQGVVLGGVFTDGALNQLRSLGFSVLHFEYPVIIDAFAEHGLDVEFDESTPTRVLERKVREVEGRLSRASGVSAVATSLRSLGADSVASFLYQMRCKLLRRIVEVDVLPLFGEVYAFPTIAAAREQLGALRGRPGSTPRGFEVFVRFSNGDEVGGRFDTEAEVDAYLRRVAGE